MALSSLANGSASLQLKTTVQTLQPVEKSVSTEQIRHTQVTMSRPIGKQTILLPAEAQEGNKHAETKDKVITLTPLNLLVDKWLYQNQSVMTNFTISIT